MSFEILSLFTSQLYPFRSPDGGTYASDGRRTYPIKSDELRTWLRGMFFAETHHAAKPAHLKEAIDTLSAAAEFGPNVHPVYTRIGEHDGRTYLDLGDTSGAAVEIDEHGWRVLDVPPVYFVRHPGMLPIAAPISTSNMLATGDDDHRHGIDRLWDFVRVPKADRMRVLAWLVSAMRAHGPFWLLSLTGEAGSAKSSAARFLRRLIDPNVADLRDGIDHNLMVSAPKSWIMAVDNLSSLSKRQSDALCRLATGTGQAKRTLFSDSSETILKACRPAILASVAEVVTEPDLIDRTLRVTMTRGAYRPESELDAEWTIAAPEILGALLDLVSLAIRELPNVRAAGYELPRMADAAMFAVAALGPGVLDDLQDGAEDQLADALDSSDLPPKLETLLTSRDQWRGTMRDLQAMIDVSVRANRLSNELWRLKPALRTRGIEVTRGRTGEARWVQLAKVVVA